MRIFTYLFSSFLWQRWYVSEMDIRSTLQSVCKKVTLDHSVDEANRLKRCKALKILGEAFVEKGNSTAAGLGDIKHRLHQQMTGGPAHEQQQQPHSENAAGHS
jgi:hypothetical protein